MNPLDMSSGDVLADRRADFAEMLWRSGDPAAAADVMLQALERAPDWAIGWFRLGEIHAAAEAVDPAATAFGMALKLDPADRAGAGLRLHLIDRSGTPPIMPAAFVETLFDQYAPSFEASLVDKLGYCAPDLLFAALQRLHPARFACAIDLGCGTGLMGERLRPVCDWLEGYDLSPRMLAIARRKGIYDAAVRADVTELDITARADLVVAADVFIYVGALEALCANVRTMLVPGGLFAFSVETLEGPEGFALRETRRFAHSDAYVRSTLRTARLRILELSAATIRMDGDRPVAGLICVASRDGEDAGPPDGGGPAD